MPRPVKRDIAAAIALEYLDAACRQRFRGSKYVGGARIASKSDDRRMFEQQQHVADLACFAQVNEFPLQAQPFRVIDASELHDGNHGCKNYMAKRL